MYVLYACILSIHIHVKGAIVVYYDHMHVLLYHNTSNGKSQHCFLLKDRSFFFKKNINKIKISSGTCTCVHVVQYMLSLYFAYCN